ncbi:MAG TPA: alpha/beta hydrolase [Limnobacter sp.]|nr:alpha/beta hydrolase [Limnobacter sp.]
MNPIQFATEKLVRTGLRGGFKTPGRLPIPLKWLAAAMNAGAPLFKTHPQSRVEYLELGTCMCALVRPASAPTDQVLLMMHGGAFFAGSLDTHLPLASELAVRCNARVFLLDYRLAPQHPYPAALEDGIAAHQALLDLDIDPRNMTWVGDSAGGAHVLSMAIYARNEGIPLPAGLVFISPFVDMTLTASSLQTKAKADPMLSVNVLKRGIEAYYSSEEAESPEASPVFAELDGLPPMLIQCGSDEILLDDSLLLERRAREAGVQVECTVHEGMWHNFQMFNAYVEKAEKALWAIADFVRRGEKT